MNGRMDVPEGLRAALGRCDLEDEVASSFEDAFGELFDLSRHSLLEKDVIELCSEAQSRVRFRLEGARGDSSRFMAIALMEAIKAPNTNLVQRRLRLCGTGSVWVEVGDLLDKGFGRIGKHTVKPIVVIPVNTGFNVHVARRCEDVEHPEVADTSLHGQWLTRMFQSDESLDEDALSRRIARSLALRAGAEKADESGWPIGSVALVESDVAVFYLLAISVFDENNNARATCEDIRSAIRSLMAFYDRFGQAHDLYIPLMGTGLSRVGMSSCEAYELLVSELCSEDLFIAGKVTIEVLASATEELGLID